jgi:Zn-dependent metalloprotease
MTVFAIVLIGGGQTLGLTPVFGAPTASGESPFYPGDVEVTRDPATGAVTFLRSRHGLESGADRAAMAASPELVFQARKVDAIGMVQIKLKQVYQGVPVYGAEVRVHYAADGQTVRALNGRFIPNLAVQPQATIGRDEAVAIVRSVQPDGELWEEPMLRIYSGHIDPTVSGDHLAWLIRIFDEKEPSRNLYVVDAHTGEVLTSYNDLTTELEREIYDAGGGTSLPGTLIGTESNPPAGDQDAVNAFDFLGDTYFYFWDENGRDSYDDNGAMLKATVHYGQNYQNAFWNGQQMVFGDGFPADDVTAHELTHAVTEHSAGLIYRNESGALNESFSDIFGEIVDQINGKGTDGEGVAWLVGEDIPNIGAFRSMSNPPDYGDPDIKGDYVCTSSDNGGVHTNSGIPNKAAYLMAVGGSFNDTDIEGIGLLKMGQVQYRALTAYLTPSSSLIDDFDALNSSCQDLVDQADPADPDRFTDFDCDQVRNALLAVEMNIALDCGGGGTWETAYIALFESPSDLALVRQYRDEILGRTGKGRLYTRLLYRHSEAALKVLLTNPDLMAEAAYLFQGNLDAVSAVLNGREGVIGNTAEILSFLKSFAGKSPPALRFWTRLLRWEIRIRQRRDRLFLGFRLE